MQRLLTTTILVGLLVATAAAFAVTERLKLTKSPIYDTIVYPKTGFSPVCGCAKGKTSVRIRLRHADTVTVRILDRDERTVRVLVAGVAAARGLNIFKWDGRTDGNVLAKDGVYQAEVHLADQHRTVVLPNEIRLDTAPPSIVAVSANRDTFSPDHDRQADFVRIRYELSKPAHVLLYLGDRKILRTHKHGAAGSFSWFGLTAKGRLQPGAYTLRIGAVDAAGNSTPLAGQQRLRVRLRYIELASRRIVVRAGQRFSIGVSTDAKRYTWKLGKRKSFSTAPVLNLKASTFRGRYTLMVAERGHVDRATVLVK